MFCTERLWGPWALLLCMAVRLACAEVCSTGDPSGSCTAARLAASEEKGAGVELVQVAAHQRRLGPARGLAANSWRHTPVKQVNKSLGLSLEDAFTGVWMCEQSWYTGGKVVFVNGSDVRIHSQCVGWKAFFGEDRQLYITAPVEAAGTVCNVTDGQLLCNNGDSCSKLDFPMERFKVSEDMDKYLGRWVPRDGSEDDTIHVEEYETGELFYNGRDNTSGFFHLEDDGFWKADMCKNGLLEGSSIRFKLSKSKRMMAVNYYIPALGAVDWSPTIMHTQLSEKKFPILMVAIPLIVLIFGVPASCFFFTMEGKLYKHEKEEEDDHFEAMDLSFDDADGEKAAEVRRNS